MAANLFGSLESILHEVDSQGNHHLLLDTANILLVHGDFDTATKLLVKANEPDRALAMCLQHDVPINEVRQLSCSILLRFMLRLRNDFSGYG